MTIKLAIPNKGRLHDPTVDLLEDSGIGIVDRGTRELFASTNVSDLEVILVRTQDIPNMVETGAADLGVTGHDLVLESQADVEELLDLDFGKAKMVIAAQENSSINSVEDIEDGTKVATEFPNVTRNYFEEKNIEIEINEVSGATEITPIIGMADLIVDISSTGTTIQTHGLEIIDTLFETSVRLIGNKKSLKEKSNKIDDITTAIGSVIKAKPCKLVMMNVPKDKISDIKKLVPGMSGPTVSKVEGTDLLAVQAVIQADEVYELVTKVREKGAQDILVVPIERILP